MFLVNFGKADITPPGKVSLSGFFARLDKLATGVANRLYLRGICFRENTPFFILTFDLLGLPSDWVEKTRGFLKERLGILPFQVLFLSTHTHSAPPVLSMRNCPGPDSSYLEFLTEQVGFLIEDLQKNCQPARIGWGKISFTEGINRRKIFPSPERLKFLMVENKKSKACLFHFAAHPYVFGPENFLLSSDLPGLICEELEKMVDFAQFLPGCGGNIQLKSAYKGAGIGKRVALDIAGRIIKAGCTGSKDGEISGKVIKVKLPYQKLPAEEELKKELLKDDCALRKSDLDEKRKRAQKKCFSEWEKDLLNVLQGKKKPEPEYGELQLLKLGDIKIVALPGEPFLELEKDISCLDKEWVLGYANGYIGYLPDYDSFFEGGYEVEGAFKYLGLWKFSPGVSKIFVQKGRDLLKRG